MSEIEKSVDVAVPRRTAYDQWTQFEDYPQFMSKVDEVVQLDDATLRWTVTIAGVTRTFDARIVEQVPDERIAWRAVDGPDHAGTVAFEALDDLTTRVALRMTYEPERWTDKVADFLDLVDRAVGEDLDAFRTFIEDRGHGTGAWRGRIAHGEVQPDGPATGGDVLPPMTGSGASDPPQAPPHVGDLGPRGSGGDPGEHP